LVLPPSAARRIYYAWKFHQHAISGGLEDPTAMLGDCRVHKLPAHRFEAFKTSFFVGPHKPRIAGHIGGENRGEAALDGFLHGTLGIGNYSKTALLAAPENERGGSAFRASRSILPNTFTRSLNPPPQMFSLLLEAEIVLPTMEPVDRGETSVSG
jgi:hypothetical protein